MLNCRDGSDEEKCRTVLRHVGYNKQLAPAPLPGDQHFYINVSIDFRQILYIDEVENFIRITFSLQKDWYDSSLTFQNLKRDKVNLIPQDDRNMIWDPLITSTNVESADKEKKTGEIYKVVPNNKFIFNFNNKTEIHNAFLFKVRN